MLTIHLAAAAVAVAERMLIVGRIITKPWMSPALPAPETPLISQLSQLVRTTPSLLRCILDLIIEEIFKDDGNSSTSCGENDSSFEGLSQQT